MTSDSFGWSRWQKTSDATIWWGKHLAADTRFLLRDGDRVEVDEGHWAMLPGPSLLGEGEPFVAVTAVANEDGRPAGHIEAPV